jgi:integrase
MKMPLCNGKCGDPGLGGSLAVANCQLNRLCLQTRGLRTQINCQHKRILLTLSANKLGLTDNCLQTMWSAHVSRQIVKKTGNPRAAQRQLGHKNPATTMQYRIPPRSVRKLGIRACSRSFPYLHKHQIIQRYSAIVIPFVR